VPPRFSYPWAARFSMRQDQVDNGTLKRGSNSRAYILARLDRDGQWRIGDAICKIADSANLREIFDLVQREQDRRPVRSPLGI
jgi:hypothetical protein